MMDYINSTPLLSVSLSNQRDGCGDNPALHFRLIEGTDLVRLFTESISEAQHGLLRFNYSILHCHPHAGYYSLSWKRPSNKLIGGSTPSMPSFVFPRVECNTLLSLLCF